MMKFCWLVIKYLADKVGINCKLKDYPWTIFLRNTYYFAQKRWMECVKSASCQNSPSVTFVRRSFGFQTRVLHPLMTHHNSF